MSKNLANEIAEQNRELSHKEKRIKNDFKTKTMDLLKLRTPIPIESVEFRIQSINKGGYATILAYKDARIDMNILDNVVGCLNWKREHTKNNANCIVSIYDKEKKEWISKEDTGSEISSNYISKGVKDKSLASDSFKRACVNWGIGRELYAYPAIQIKLKTDEFVIKEGKAKQTFKLNLGNWIWEAKFENNKISTLYAKDETNTVRFSYPKTNKTIPENIPPDNRTILTPENKKFWENAVNHIAKGNSISEIRAKYKLSKTHAEQLENESKNL